MLGGDDVEVANADHTAAGPAGPPPPGAADHDHPGGRPAGPPPGAADRAADRPAGPPPPGAADRAADRPAGPPPPGAADRAADRPAGPPPPGAADHNHAAAGPGDLRPPGGTRDSAAVLMFVERFATLLGQMGFPRMPARVFTALLSTDSGRLTAAELAEMLRVSPAAISSGVRYLVQVGLASREREPGSRRDRYRVPDDVWYDVVRVREQVTARWAPTLQEGIEALGPGTPAAERLAETADFFEFLRKQGPELLARWSEHRASRPEP